MNQHTLLETPFRLRELPREAAMLEFKSNLEDLSSQSADQDP